MALGLTPGPDLDWHGTAARERDMGQMPAPPASAAAVSARPPSSTAQEPRRASRLSW